MSSLNVIVNFTKREYLHPESFNDASLVSYSHGGTGGIMHILAYLLEKPDRIGLSTLSRPLDTTDKNWKDRPLGEPIVESADGQRFFESPLWVGRWAGDSIAIIDGETSAIDVLPVAEQLQALADNVGIPRIENWSDGNWDRRKREAATEKSIRNAKRLSAYPADCQTVFRANYEWLYALPYVLKYYKDISRPSILMFELFGITKYDPDSYKRWWVKTAGQRLATEFCETRSGKYHLEHLGPEPVFMFLYGIDSNHFVEAKKWLNKQVLSDAQRQVIGLIRNVKRLTNIAEIQKLIDKFNADNLTLLPERKWLDAGLAMSVKKDGRDPQTPDTKRTRIQLQDAVTGVNHRQINITARGSKNGEIPSVPTGTGTTD